MPDEDIFNPDSTDPIDQTDQDNTSITPIDVTPKQKNLLTGASSVSNDIERSLSQIINLNNESEMHEPTCQICSSPLRSDAENIWAKETKAQPIKELFLNKGGIRISKDLIENHMRYHMDKGIKEIQKVEYTNRLQRLKNNSMTTLGKIDSAEAIILERIVGVNSLPPSSGDLSQAEVEKIKSSETVRLVSSWGNLLKLRATIMGEMRSRGEVISLPTNDFIKLFTDAYTMAQSDHERTLIMDLLNKIKQIGK